MSMPLTQDNKPNTRSSSKKTGAQANNLGASPILRGSTRKRKSSCESAAEGPAAKKMAENQILEAINGIKTSMAAMENQLRAAPTKTDFNNLVTEMRNVKETVIRNTDRIDTLYDLRKNDGELLTRRVEKIVVDKMARSKTAVQPVGFNQDNDCLLYTSPSPRDRQKSRMPSSA